MADQLLIEVVDFGLLSVIDHAASSVEKPLELMRLIGSTMEANVALRFVTKTDPAGHPWLPLAPETLKRKKGRGSILEASGLGKASLTNNPGDDFVEIGFGESYMGYHETGTRNMPRRQLLTDDFVTGTLGKDDQQDLIDVVTGYLAGLGLN